MGLIVKLRDSAFLLTATASLIVTSCLYLSVLHSHTKLVEDRGVHDDICYLRQAYLFRTKGVIGGLNTDNPSVRYAMSLIHKAGLTGQLASSVPCHNFLQATNKFSIQYPPGTGFLLSAFPEGSQASGLYIASSTTIFLMLMWLIATARSQPAACALGVIGSLTLYLMVNPAKASYSIAPTMPLCIAAAYLTIRMFSGASSTTKILAAALAGLLLGFATDIRLSSALLAFGYAAVFALEFVRNRTWVTFLQPIAFGISMIAGAIPTLAANFINAGSPFSTAYGGIDTAPPLTSLDPLTTQIKWYLFSGTHGVLTWLALVLLITLATVTIRRSHTSLRLPLLVAIITLASNDAYFITHPVRSQYYSVPPAMLGLWVGIFVLVFWTNRKETSRSISSIAISRISAAVVTLTLTAALTLLAYWGMFSRPQFTPGLTIEPNAVIWIGGSSWMDGWKSDGLALAFQYRFQRHAISGLSTLSILDQDKIIATVATDSRPQFIVADDQEMQEIVARLTKTGKISSLGRVFGANMYRVGDDLIH